MRFLRITIALCALAVGMPAAAIDVSSQTTLMLQSGDALGFLFTDSSFARFASGLGMSPYPSEIFFNLMSAPVGAPGQFTIELQSVDGSVSSAIAGPVEWTTGMVQTAQYSGSASVLMDNLTLANTLSQGIFAGSDAELVLTYAGPDITVGLPGYTLEHDLSVTLAGGPLTIGAMNYGVTLDNTTAPEPEAALTFGAGLLLCAISFAMKRYRRSR
jgi:hypothetical protein